MTREKKDEPMVKLEKEFHNFQKEWTKFLKNDFHHLVVSVDTMHDEIKEIKQGMGLMQDNMETMNQTVKTQLETTRRIVNILEREH